MLKVKFDRVVFELCEWTETDRHTDHKKTSNEFLLAILTTQNANTELLYLEFVTA